MVKKHFVTLEPWMIVLSEPIWTAVANKDGYKHSTEGFCKKNNLNGFMYEAIQYSLQRII